MLHSHPRIAIPPETRFVVDTYRRRLGFGDLRVAEHRAALARSIVERRRSKFHDLGLDADAVLAEIVDGPPTVGSALGIVLRAYTRRFGKPRWGDKRPSYYRNVGVLRRLFPDAQFVHVIRDGRDCAASLKRMPWWEQDTVTAIATWVEAVDYGRRARRRLPADTWHEVGYERLVNDPTAELTRLCAFLGEDYDEAMTRPRRTAGNAVPRRKKWHTRTHDEVDAARVGAWQSGLEPWELDLFERVAGSRLRGYGYPARQVAREPSRALVRHYRRVAAVRRASHRKRALGDWLRDAASAQPVAAELTSAQLAARR